MEQPSILIIEDEQSLAASIAYMVELNSLIAIVAENGGIALQILASTPVSMVLCDINLPDITGYDVLKKLQHYPLAAANIPFIFLTAYGDDDDRQYGLNLGATDYLVKPFGMHELMKVVKKYVS